MEPSASPLWPPILQRASQSAFPDTLRSEPRRSQWPLCQAADRFPGRGLVAQVEVRSGARWPSIISRKRSVAQGVASSPALQPTSHSASVADLVRTGRPRRAQADSWSSRHRGQAGARRTDLLVVLLAARTPQSALLANTRNKKPASRRVPWS